MTVSRQGNIVLVANPQNLAGRLESGKLFHSFTFFRKQSWSSSFEQAGIWLRKERAIRAKVVSIRLNQEVLRKSKRFGFFDR